MTITTISSEKDRKLFILDSSRGYNVFDFGKD